MPNQDEPKVHLLYPLLYMHGVYSNVIDKVYRHVEVSWSLFMQADNGQLVVVRSEPRAIDFVPSDMEGQFSSLLLDFACLTVGGGGGGNGQLTSCIFS